MFGPLKMQITTNCNYCFFTCSYPIFKYWKIQLFSIYRIVGARDAILKKKERRKKKKNQNHKAFSVASFYHRDKEG